MMNSNMMTPADVAAVMGNNNGAFGDNGAWWLIVILLFACGGWGNGRFVGFGGAGAAENYVLGSDFATIQRQLSDGFGSTESKLDSVNNGICSLGYDQLGQMNGINQNIMTTGYGLQTQLADCCCKTQSGLERVNTQAAMNTAAIQNQIQQCCCDNEKLVMQSEFNAQRYNCDTLAAIDKLGDRIIGYMDNAENNRMRDELATYKLAASQQAQNNYLINQLRPSPIPAFPVPNPFAPYYGGFGNGTTIA